MTLPNEKNENPTHEEYLSPTHVALYIEILIDEALTAFKKHSRDGEKSWKLKWAFSFSLKHWIYFLTVIEKGFFVLPNNFAEEKD